MDIFDFLYEDFKFERDKPIKLFEAFAGIGTQHMALKRLGVDVELVGIAEVDKHAIESYQAIHGKVKNYGGIGSFDELPPNIDICTWSFPCTDMSQAGEQKGMVDGTQSNYGYTFLDTVNNMKYEDRPQVLIMENVEALAGDIFKDDYAEIHSRLENMGYQSYGEVLVASNHGIPQKRKRLFVISVKGNYVIDFPKPQELKGSIVDYLEDDITDDYFIKEQLIKTYLVKKVGKFPRRKRFLNNLNRVDNHIANTLTTRQGSTPIDNYIKYFNGKIDLDVIATKENLMSREVMIRKLTPLEAWRLMGIKDEDFHKAKSTGMSDSQLYKQAGNAIVVDVLMAIFNQMIK